MLNVLNKVEEAIIALLLVAMTFLVFADVILRFVFNTGWLWSEELTLLLSAWLVLFGASYCVKTGSHIGVDAFVKLFPAAGRRFFTIIACLLSLCYCGLVLRGSWVYLSKMHKIGITLRDLPIPIWIADSVLIIGFVLIAIRILVQLWYVITGKIDTFKHADEASESMEIVEELKRMEESA